MIDDFVKFLFRRNKYIGLLVGAIVVIASTMEIVNNLQGFGGLSPIYGRALWITALLFLLVGTINVAREDKGYYSFQQRRLARAVIVLLCQIIIFLIWIELETGFTFVTKYKIIAYRFYGTVGLIGLVWFVRMNIKDKRLPSEFTILVCEFSEGASKEIPKDRHITHYVLQSLRDKKTSEKVKIVHVEEVVLEHDRAITLGRNAKALAVLFGFYTKLPTNILIDIKFEVIRKPTVFAPVDIKRRTIPIEELDRGQLQVSLGKDFASIANFFVGLSEYSAKDYSQAVQHFQSAIIDIEGDEPSSHHYSLGLDVLHLYLGNSYYLTGDYDAAKKEFELAISYNEASAKALHNLGVFLYGANDPEQALEYFNRALKADPELLVAYRNRAFVLMDINEYPGAEKDLVHYLDLQPDDVETIRLLAICRSAAGDFQGAIERYESLLKIEPTRYSDQFSLAKEYFKAGDQKAAERIWLSLSRKRKYASRAYGLLGDQLYQRKNFSKAINYFSKALKRDKNNPYLFFARGSAYCAISDLESAAKDFQNAAILEPSMVDAHYNLGNIYLKAGKPSLAVESFSKAIDLVSEFPEALFNRAQAFMKLDMFQQVIDDCDKFIESTGDPNGKGYALSAMANLRREDFLGAIRDFNKAVQHNPDSNQFKSALAKTHLSYACYLIEHGADDTTILTHYNQAKKLDLSLEAEAKYEEKFQLLMNEITMSKVNGEMGNHNE